MENSTALLRAAIDSLESLVISMVDGKYLNWLDYMLKYQDVKNIKTKTEIDGTPKIYSLKAYAIAYDKVITPAAVLVKPNVFI